MRLFSSPRVSELEERLAKAEASLGQLRLEFEETLDKVHRWMQRTRARVHVDATPPAPEAPEGASPASSGMDPVSARIVAQRARRFNGRRQETPDEEDG